MTHRRRVRGNGKSGGGRAENRLARRRPAAPPSGMATLRTAGSWVVAMAMLVLPLAAAAPKKKAPGPNDPVPSTKTFFIAGVKTDADVQAIIAAASRVKSVDAVAELTPTSGFANISFDHRAVTHQQIAQAIREAGSFEVSFKFLVPEYTKGDHAAKIDAVFARVAKRVKVETLDREKGSFVLHFLPFTPEPGQPQGTGFNFGHIAHPIVDPAPKGLGLRIQQIGAGTQARPAPAAKKAAKS
jgi:copper chaperone CopZ